MFVACILIWRSLSSAATSAKNTVVAGLEIGKNSAGPLQSQTTADIEQTENAVKSWHVTWSALSKPKTYYQNIANKLWQEMQSTFNIDEAALVSWCKPLSKNELVAVAVCFGVKEASVFGLTTWTGHIFQAFDIALEGTFKTKEMAAMKAIWSVTKLW